MGLRSFAVPAMDPGEAQADLNCFLRGHRVVNLHRELVVDGRPLWCVSAEYVEAPARPGGDEAIRRNRVDYREVRKEIAEKEGVPVCAICTDQQLDVMAQKGACSRPFSTHTAPRGPRG